MSRTIDSRVVEMRFDNKQFEAGTKQTMSTLAKLKEALKLPDTGKALEGIDKATKNISVDGIAAGVDLLTKRFSTLGIVGMRVIENITDGLMSKLNAAVGFVTDSIVSGGVKRAMNIENAHFQLQSLLKDETKVQAVMADAMESVDGTAYAYDEAAKAASQFAASGLKAGEDMLGALKGITGVAAMTNSSFEDISRIFTTVAGNGRLMGDQLLQLSGRGLNAASTLADYFREVRGQADMTEGTIREMVSDGEISFKTFAEAMTWAFGDSAKRANETFTGAMSNMKSALARIGAGFISPLVEQNGELVNLFNALRIKINDVKSALVFDEQSSAISGLVKNTSLLNETISSYVKTGSTGFELITKSILGTSKSEEELTKINEKVSDTFNRVKETGVVTSEALKEFEENGFVAAHSVSKYINGVIDGSIKASGSVRQSVQELTNGMKVDAYSIRSFAESGKLSFDIFADAITYSASEAGDKTKILTESFKSMFSEIKKNGTVTRENLEELGRNGVKSAAVLRDYMNGVTNGSIRATYAIRSSIEEMTGGSQVMYGDITRFAEEGKISFDIFQAAMEETYGDSMALSKQFTDSFLGMIKNVVKAINEADMTKPMEIFYFWVESVKNITKGLFSVVKPIGKAFADVFLSFNADDIINFSEVVERLTSKMRLSEKGSKNLHDAMEGLFSVVKLVVDIFFKLFGVIIPINKPVVEMGGGFLSLAGAIGRALSSFTDLIRSSTLLKKAFEGLKSGFDAGAEGFVNLIKKGKEFIKAVLGMEETTRLVNSIGNAFQKLGIKATPYIKNFIDDTKSLLKSLFDFEDIDLDKVLGSLAGVFENLSWEIEHFSFETVERAIDALKGKIQELTDLAMSNEGIATFVTNFKNFGEELRDAFTLDNLLDRIEKVMEVFGKFFNWIKENLGPAFEDFNVGSAVAAGGGIGIIYAMIKAAKAFEKIAGSIKTFPDLFGAVKGTLVAYQKELKADAILKIAAAIAVLAGALVLLSFADTDRLMSASAALSLIAGTLMIGITQLLEAINKGRELNDAARILSKGLSSTMKKFGRAIEIRALGTAVKKFAESIAIIAVSIIGLGIMYRKDKDALMAGVELVKNIGIALAAIMGVMTILGTVFKSGATSFAKSALGVLGLSAALSMCVAALSKLFKMEFPPDWEFRLSVLAGMLGGLGILAIALGVASRLAGANKMAALPILAMAVLLVTTVSALDKLFKMEFPPNWEEKLGILGLIFAAFGALMITMGAAARLAKGSIKAGGTILAMCAFVVTIVAALMVLALIPSEKLMKGATALGIVLVTLGVALHGAGSIVSENTGKAVLAMAIVVGTITASLAVLAMVPFSKILKGAISLSGILLVLAENFKQIAKITNEKAWLNVVAMIAAVMGITYSLYVLAEQPWGGLLSASVSLSAVLLSLAQTLKMISDMDDLNLERVGLFLLATTSLVPIGAALYLLSEQPWSGMLIAAISMSAVLLTFGQTLKMISEQEGINLEKIALFLLATTSLVPITASLYLLSMQPWSGLLAAGIALSGVILAFSAGFALISKANPDLKAMAVFLAASVSIGVIAASLYVLTTQPWEGLLASAASLSMVLLAMSGAMGICTTVGAAAPAAITGIGLLDLFVANFTLLLVALGKIFETEGAKSLMAGGAAVLVQIGQAIGDFVGAIINGVLTGISSALPQIGSDLSDFMINLEPFISGSKSIDAGSLAGVGFLAAIIIALTAGEIIHGIANLFGLSLVEVAVELSDFMIELQPFIEQSKQLTADSMKACSYLAAMIIMLTASELIAGISKFFGLSGSIADFGKQLAEFGPYIRQFADDVKDVKAEAVQGAASAAEIMANLAKKLPGTGGLVQKIFGEKSLAEFGKELVKFGPSIKLFGEQVKDVKPEAVQGASAAAEIMANLAAKLPAQGGLIQKIFGERSLSEFGKELVKFGPSIKLFAEQVKTIDPAAATGASLITRIMSDLANNLPSSETLWNKIFGGGQVTLSEFGQELVRFGQAMSNFSASVSGIDVAQVDGAIESFKHLIDLATYVQGTSADGLVEFSNQLSQVGVDSVDKFVQAFTDAGPKATRAIKELMSSVLSSIKSGASDIEKNATFAGNNLCIGLQSGITAKQPLTLSTVKNLTTNIISTMRTGLPSNTFNTIGQNLVQALINGINAKKPLTLSTVRNLCTAIIAQFRTSLPTSTFNTIGQNVVQGVINGIITKRPSMLSTISSLCAAIINQFRTSLPTSTFNTIGQNVVQGVINGVIAKKSNLLSLISEICRSIVDRFNSGLQSGTFRPFGENIINWVSDGIRSARGSVEDAAAQVARSIGDAFRNNISSSEYYDIGANAALGLKHGIESKIHEIANASINAARQAVEAARRELQVASPSKVMTKIGSFFSLGLAKGILSKINAIIAASKTAADSSIEPINEAIKRVTSAINSGEFDMDPVIRPVVDLSDVHSGVNEIASLMNQTYSLKTAYDNVMMASSTFDQNRKAVINDEGTKEVVKEGDKYEFIQNNYSPKALSRSEIYRQTNNQFSAFRRAVNPS